MEYSSEVMTALVQTHHAVFNEIERRDTVFRRRFSDEDRRRVAPWTMAGRKALQQEEFDLWVRLGANEMSAAEAIEAMTDLMEVYYEGKYPLGRS